VLARSSLPGRRKSREFVDAVRHRAARRDEIGDETLVHVESAFVLGPVAEVVALRQDSPDLRAEAERLGQNLEHDVPSRWTKSLIPEGGQT